MELEGDFIAPYSGSLRRLGPSSISWNSKAISSPADLLSERVLAIVHFASNPKVPMSVDQMPPLPEVEQPQIVRSRAVRVLYVALGFLFLAIGIAGYIVPVLPGTVFLLMAAGFFFKSSERMYLWVLNHRRFGPTVRAYRAGYGIRRKVKIYAITLMLVSVGLSIAFAVDGAVVRVLLIALAAFGAAFILTRPTTEDVLARR